MYPHINDIEGLPVIGEWYTVPCAVSSRNGQAVPVLGPVHSDPEIMKDPQDHIHVDWRFASQRYIEETLQALEGTQWNDKGSVQLPTVRALRVEKGLWTFKDASAKCQRQLPFMVRTNPVYYDQPAPGFRCPHRGVRLRGHWQDSRYNMLCPLHGACINLCNSDNPDLPVNDEVILLHPTPKKPSACMHLDPQIMLEGLAARAVQLKSGDGRQPATCGLGVKLSPGHVEIEARHDCWQSRFYPSTEHEWMELCQAEQRLEEHVLEVLAHLPDPILERIQVHAQCLMLLNLMKRPVPAGVPLQSLAMEQRLRSKSKLLNLYLFEGWFVSSISIDELEVGLYGPSEQVLKEIETVQKALDNVKTEAAQLLTQAKERLQQEWHSEVQKNPPVSESVNAA